MISFHLALATAAAFGLMARALHLYRDAPLPAPLRAACRALGVIAAFLTTIGLILLTAEAGSALYAAEAAR